MKVKTVIAHKDNLRTELITEDETIKAVTTQDVSKTLEYVKNLGDNAPGKDFRHVAEVPMVVYEKAVQEGWANDQSAWKKWLNSPENKPFRTWQGKI